MGYDNLSDLKDWLSDALCRLATGASFSTRLLHTDYDEALFNATRPALLNGISDVATRGDLMDRMVSIQLPRIPEVERREERELWAAFDVARPGMLGGLLDAASAALRNLPTMTLDRKPRMVDFARWVEAAAPHLGWQRGAFLAAYTGMREQATDIEIDASPIGEPLISFAEEQATGRWTGTAAELLSQLNTRYGDKRHPKGWPETARALADALRRLSPALETHGVTLLFKRGHGGVRLWSIHVGAPREDRVTQPPPVSSPETRSASPASPAASPVSSALQSHIPDLVTQVTQEIPTVSVEVTSKTSPNTAPITPYAAKNGSADNATPTASPASPTATTGANGPAASNGHAHQTVRCSCGGLRHWIDDTWICATCNTVPLAERR